MMFDGGEYFHSAAMNRECFTSFTSPTNKKSKDKRKFSDEQTKSLETIFESETKLEPRKKLQLATDLGLQPRQVAIWFQNKRARWKSKQLEQDYIILRTNYNNLSSKFEALKKEKQSLVIQLQQLNDLMQKSRGENQRCEQAVADNSTSDQLERGDHIEGEFAVKHSLSLERSEHGLLSDDDINLTAEYLGLDEETELLNTVEPADSSLTSPENCGTLDSNGLLDQRGTRYQWWDFWS